MGRFSRSTPNNPYFTELRLKYNRHFVLAFRLGYTRSRFAIYAGTLCRVYNRLYITLIEATAANYFLASFLFWRFTFSAN